MKSETTQTNFTCEEILKLIRATKTFNLDYISCAGLVISRNGGKQSQVSEVGTQLDPVTADVQPVTPNGVLQEVDEFERENLLIDDPEEYERQVS